MSGFVVLNLERKRYNSTVLNCYITKHLKEHTESKSQSYAILQFVPVVQISEGH